MGSGREDTPQFDDATLVFQRGPADSSAQMNAAPGSARGASAPESFEPLPQQALSAGARIGHFRVKAPLGQGGMGIVYRAEDETLHREVALKVLPPFHLDDVERRRLLLREARAAAAVNHPNIATIHEVGEAEGRIYLAMELIHGQTLRERLATGRLPVEEAIGIARQIVRGLQKAHKAGLVHRDLKPDNIMISDDGLAKVLDFGLAKRREQPVADADFDGAATIQKDAVNAPLVGTPRYMSPEQVRDEAVDHRSDLFSFGVMLYEMLAGSCPFVGSEVLDLFAAILYTRPEPLSRVNPEISPALAHIVDRCLAKAPEDRYPNCESLLKEIDQLFPSARSFHAARAMTAKGRAPRRRANRLFTRGRAFVAAALLGALGIGVAISVARRGAAPAAVTAAPTPRPTAITDLPLPSSPRPDAIAAYKTALQSLRDGDWGGADENLRRALALDPLMAAAHLRLALSFQQDSATVESRSSYARALQGRASLGERDQVLLQALEPLLGHTPSDRSLTVRRLREATERYPLDAEFFLLLALFELGDRDASLRAAARASELDPHYADAWQMLGLRLSAANRLEEALGAFDRCVASSPASVDCRGARADQYRILGRCAEMAEDLQHAISVNPKAGLTWYDDRLTALYALGRPREAVLEAMAQKWAQLPADQRRPVELLDRAELDFDAGQFARAEGLAREGSALIQLDRNALSHAEYAVLFVKIYTETGRLEDAAEVADGYLKRRDVWEASRLTRSLEMLLLRTLFRAGKLSQSAFAKRQAAWLAEGPGAGDTDPGHLWFFAYVNGIERPEEAEEALAALGKLPPGAPSQAILHEFSGRIGRMYLLAGRVDDARKLLRPEGQPCIGPGSGYKVSFAFGQAEEQKGNEGSACAAYQVVLDHWGQARPPSVTAKKARARAKALDCATRKPTATP